MSEGGGRGRGRGRGRGGEGGGEGEGNVVKEQWRNARYNLYPVDDIFQLFR